MRSKFTGNSGKFQQNLSGRPNHLFFKIGASEASHWSEIESWSLTLPNTACGAMTSSFLISTQ